MVHAKMRWYEALKCYGKVTRKCYDSLFRGVHKWWETTMGFGTNLSALGVLYYDDLMH